jgi:hypothetical protein
MARDRSGPRAWLAVAELRDLCREGVEEEWDVARQACAQCFKLGKSVIAKAEAGGNWEVMAGIGVAGMGLRKSFSQNWDFARPEQNGLRHSLSPFPSSLLRV